MSAYSTMYLSNGIKIIPLVTLNKYVVAKGDRALKVFVSCYDAYVFAQSIGG